MRINKKVLGCPLILIIILTASPLASLQENDRSYQNLSLGEKRLKGILDHLIEKTGTGLVSKKNNFKLSVLETPFFRAEVEPVEIGELMPDYSSEDAQFFVIYISRGLIDILTHEEQVAVIAHEIGHIVNGDFAVSPFKIMTTLLIRIMSFNKLGHNEEAEEEIRADKFAVSLLKRCGIDPQALLTALEKFYDGNIPLKRMLSLEKHILKQKNFPSKKTESPLSF